MTNETNEIGMHHTESNPQHETAAVAAHHPKPSRHRARWAAIGAAVAVSLGAGGIGLTYAAGEQRETVYVSLDEPCRLVDSRLPTSLWDGIGPGETITIGASGFDCPIPEQADAISVNLTGLNATAVTYFTLFPSTGGPPPTVSNLNLHPGAAPTPNLANVRLHSLAEFDLYNAFGTADFIIDVAGYYIDPTTATSSATEATTGSILNPSPGPVQPVIPVIATAVATPAAGRVIVNTSVWLGSNVDGQYADCSISTTPGLIDTDASYRASEPLSMTRAFDVDGTADTLVVAVSCQAGGGGPVNTFALGRRAINAIFIPA